jgi:Protein of unknown function (DUF559)
MTPKGIQHRLATGRLRLVTRGVYVVGRPEISERGRWMAAVLASGPGALLSHCSAAALWGMYQQGRGTPIDVVVPRPTTHRRAGVRMHRRVELRDGERREVDGIPVTDPVSTLVDVAVGLATAELERAINEACQRGLVDPEAMRIELDDFPRRPGAGRLRRLLDRDTFVLTETRLEQLFVPIARDVGLPLPETQVWLNGHRVDFFWPDLGLVVEADSLRYHRTATKQAADARRDQAHTAAGLRTLHFTHGQIRFEPDYVRRILAATVAAGE